MLRIAICDDQAEQVQLIRKAAENYFKTKQEFVSYEDFDSAFASSTPSSTALCATLSCSMYACRGFRAWTRHRSFGTGTAGPRSSS